MRPVLRARRTVLLGAALLATPVLLALPAPASAATACPVDHRPPTVTLTVPQAGAVLAAGTGTLLGATASDPDGTVTKVRFFAGSDLVGIDTTSPYFAEWSTPFAAGTYLLTAVARDNSGAVTTSAPVQVTVLPPPTP